MSPEVVALAARGIDDAQVPAVNTSAQQSGVLRTHVVDGCENPNGGISWSAAVTHQVLTDLPIGHTDVEFVADRPSHIETGLPKVGGFHTIAVAAGD